MPSAGAAAPPGPDVRSAARDRSPFVVDGLLAVGLLVALASSTGPGAGVPAWIGPVLLVCLTLPLAVRWRWPRAVLATTLVAAVVAVVAGLGPGPFLAVAYAVYPVSASRPTRRPIRGYGHLAGLAGLAAVPVLTGTPLPLDAGPWLGAALFAVLVVGASWVVGRVVREHRLLTAQAAQRLAERAVTAERLHIARELHDVVAHSISVIAVKAGVANHVLAARPEEAADALRVIEGASRSALTELRHLLGVLRSEDGDTPPELGPAPGLAGVPVLAAQAERAGIEVELVLPDEAGTAGLPEGVELSAHRIVQEALTNVIKHAGPARCRVEVRIERARLRIAVVDTGVGAGATRHAGHGLIGMRERVAVYGGAFRAGPEPGGGFAVHADLPLDGTAR